MAADGLHAVVYKRCITRQLRVLDAKIARLELQLKDEMEKISSCSELLDEIITKPRTSPCSGLREQLDKARAKRDKVYQRKNQQQGNNDGDDNGAPPPADEAAATAMSSSTN